MNVSSVLGYLPTSVINPVYNGTKAFMHAWTTNMRTQLRDTNIKVVEIVPPKVVSVASNQSVYFDHIGIGFTP